MALAVGSAAAKTYSEEWNIRGNDYVSEGKYAEAISCFDKALQFDPYFESAWYIKGVIGSELGKYAEAIEYLDNALELDPDFAYAWYNKGRCYSRMGEKAKTLDNLKKAVDLQPGLKKTAKEDEGFEAYWDDPDFLEIVSE